MRVGILQPSYLPWIGFFEQMKNVDLFVLYDDVQFDKNGWRNRNRIKTSQGVKWLTVPVHAKYGDLLKDVKIDEGSNWQKKHARSLEMSYSKAPYFDDYYPCLRDILFDRWRYLVDLNVAFIGKISECLGLHREIRFSSELDVPKGERTGRLVKICKLLDADEFYEGESGQNYIDSRQFSAEGIKLVYQKYQHPSYSQQYGDFEPYLSVVDLLFNHGPESLDVITQQKSIAFKDDHLEGR